MLIERGEQYKRAIGLYVKKWGKYPAKIEDLENTNNIRYLRRRYIDPMTGKNEWRLVHAGPGGVLTDSLVQKGAVGPDGKPLAPGSGGMPGSSGMNTANMGSAFGMNATPGNTPSGTTPTGTTDPNQPPEVNQAVKARPSDRIIGQPAIPGQPGLDPAQQSQNAYGYPPQAPSNYQQYPQSGQPVYPGQPGYGSQTQAGYPQSGNPQQAQNNPGQTPYAQPGIPGQPVQNYPMQPGQIQGQMIPGQIPGQMMPGQIPGQMMPGQIQGQMMPGQIQGQMMPGQIPGQAVPAGYAGQPGTFQPVTSPGFNQNPGFNQGQGGFNQSPGFNQNSGLSNPPAGGFGNQGQSGASPAAQMIQQMLTQPRQTPANMMAAGMNTSGLGPGIAGVATNFKGPAIKVYEERRKYQEWEFVYDPRKEAAKKMGAAMGGQAGTNPGNSPSQTGMSGFGQSGTQSGFGQQNPQTGFGQQNPQSGFGQQNPQSGFGR